MSDFYFYPKIFLFCFELGGGAREEIAVKYFFIFIYLISSV